MTEYSPRDYWEKRAKIFQRWEHIRTIRAFLSTPSLKAHLKKNIESICPKSLLEVGCGPGRLIELYRAVDWVFCVDFSPTMLNRIKSKIQREYFRNISLFQMAAENLGFADNSMDLVVSSHVLLHVPYSNIDEAVTELTRVTGKYITLVDYSHPDTERLKTRKTSSHVFTHDYRRLFSEKGLKLVKAEKLPFGTQECLVFRKS